MKKRLDTSFFERLSVGLATAGVCTARYLHRLALLICVLFLMNACSGPTKGLGSSLKGSPMHRLETLSANFQISFRSEEKHGSAQGMLVYKEPGHLRLVILNPLGTVAMEVLMQQEELTVLYPGSGVAYRGHVSQLPPKLGRSGWSLLRWMLESTPPEIENGSYLRTVGSKQETISVQNGIVAGKSLQNGEQVSYSEHAVVSGVILPHQITLHSEAGNRIKIVLDEPEVNNTLSEQAFVINLAGAQLAPLSALQDSNL